MNFHIRRGSADDVGEVYHLAQQGLREAWSQKSLREALFAGCDVWLCESQGALMAYSLSQQVLDETHLLQLVVSASARRQGLATRLMQHVFGQYDAMQHYWLEVRASNAAAIAFYTSLEFEQVGVRSLYYAARDGLPAEDALVMHRFDNSCISSHVHDPAIPIE